MSPHPRRPKVKVKQPKLPCFCDPDGLGDMNSLAVDGRWIHWCETCQRFRKLPERNGNRRET